ncbi:MAG: LysR family transcriptional regulator [Bdellovibrionaceae bacterium]|nr:LysR family transcriptional regulator [Pseudobdellovibrionaceae bacterium]
MLNGRGIKISAEGTLLYKKALNLLNAVEELKSKPTLPKKNLKIAAIEVFTCSIPSILYQDTFFKDYEMSFFELSPGQIETAVGNGTVDFGITYISSPNKNIKYLKVATFETKVYSVNKKFLDLPFENVPFVVPEDILDFTPQNIKNRDGWKESLQKRNIKFKTNSLATALPIVDSGYAAIYLPDFLPKLFFEEIFTIPNPKKIKSEKRNAFLVLRANSDENLMTNKVAKCLRQLCL